MFYAAELKYTRRYEVDDTLCILRLKDSVIYKTHGFNTLSKVAFLLFLVLSIAGLKQWRRQNRSSESSCLVTSARRRSRLFVTSSIQPREYNLIIPTSCAWSAAFFLGRNIFEDTL